MIQSPERRRGHPAEDHSARADRWRTDESVSNLMREIRTTSSRWIHPTFPKRVEFAWQEGCTHIRNQAAPQTSRLQVRAAATAPRADGSSTSGMCSTEGRLRPSRGDHARSRPASTGCARSLRELCFTRGYIPPPLPGREHARTHRGSHLVAENALRDAGGRSPSYGTWLAFGEWKVLTC